MSVIPCKDTGLGERIKAFAEVLKTQAHLLGDHGLSEREFYEGGLFRGSIERVRGQISADMREKREFVRHVLNFMNDRKFIAGWDSSGSANRFDYTVTLNNGRVAVIELKGCLDGNNTNIFERPQNAQEFIIWSVCNNKASDPRVNVWSGIHTRLSAEIISKEKQVDGLVVWSMICGATGYPCPKVTEDSGRRIEIGPFTLPPPCIYLFPATIPSPRNNSAPPPQNIEDVQILKAFYDCFGVRGEELNHVHFEVSHQGADTVRKTRIERGGQIQKESDETAIRRS